MKNIKIATILLLLLTFFSCNEDEDLAPEVCGTDLLQYTLIDYITGMDFFDENANSIGQWGRPNHKKGDAFVYPIPSTGILSVSSQNKIKRIWLISTTCVQDFVTPDITTLSQNLNFEVAEIENLQVKDIPTPDFNNNINLNFEDVSIGMYRLFYQLESDEIFWYNLYIDPSVNNIPDFSFMDNGCN